MGSALLTRTMARRHQLPMHSYDRLFPNQDTLPRGGFGNLIALPLQHQARRAGCTVFVDRDWEPFPDQWAYLAACPRIPVARVHEIAAEADRSGLVLGVAAWDGGEADLHARSTRVRGAPPEPIPGPLPKRIVAVLAGQLSIDKAGLPSPLLDRIRRLAAFQNPEFYKRQALRLSTASTPRVILCAQETAERILLPRGCLPALEELLRAGGVELVLEERRVEGAPLEVRFHGELTPAQQEAADALLPHETGVLVAPPGAGKTVVAIALVAARRRATLVLVHRTQLLDQWRSRLSVFLDRPLREIGQIGGGKRKFTGGLDVAMLQSLAGRGAVDGLAARYGQVLVDECHHVPALSFEAVLREVRARFVLGLTATPRRRDGLHPILEFQLGPPRHTIAAKQSAASLGFEQQLIVRETEFRMEPAQEAPGIQELYRRLADDGERNCRILDDVLQALEQGRSPIVLTERRDHLEFLAHALGGVAKNLVVLRGGMGARQRREVAERLAGVPEGEERLLLATGRFIGEGFDDARLDTLFLALPVSWRGTFVQYAGRLHRSRQGKTQVRIYDYVDRGLPVLEKMFARRMAGYRGMGYRLEKAAGLEEAADGGGYVVDYDVEDIGTTRPDPD